MSLLDSEFRADRLNVHNLKLNGIDISNFQIETLGDGKYIDSLRGDIQVQITPSMLDANGNYVIQQIPGLGRFARVGAYMSDYFGTMLKINGNNCTIRDYYSNTNKNITNYYDNKNKQLIINNYKPSHILEESGNIFFKMDKDSNVYKFDGTNISLDSTRVFGKKEELNYNGLNTASAGVLYFPKSQYAGITKDFTIEFKIRNYSSSGVLQFWDGNSNLNWNGSHFYNKTSIVKIVARNGLPTEYYIDGVLTPNWFNGIDLSVYSAIYLGGTSYYGRYWNTTYKEYRYAWLWSYSSVDLYYFKIFDGSNNLVVYYNFKTDTYGGPFVNKGSNGGSMSWISGGEGSYTLNKLEQDVLQTFDFDELDNVNANTLIIKPSRTDFTTINLDLWLEQ